MGGAYRRGRSLAAAAGLCGGVWVTGRLQGGVRGSRRGPREGKMGGLQLWPPRTGLTALTGDEVNRGQAVFENPTERGQTHNSGDLYHWSVRSGLSYSCLIRTCQTPDASPHQHPLVERPWRHAATEHHSLWHWDTPHQEGPAEWQMVRRPAPCDKGSQPPPRCRTHNSIGIHVASNERAKESSSPPSKPHPLHDPL